MDDYLLLREVFERAVHTRCVAAAEELDNRVHAAFITGCACGRRVDLVDNPPVIVLNVGAMIDDLQRELVRCERCVADDARLARK